jgi:thioester reductase-like protein
MILLTGASGYVGLALARELLERTDEELTLWLHAANADEARAKQEALMPRFSQWASRVDYRWGELGADGAFDQVDAARVTKIVHAAAVTRFNVDAETAKRVNLDGSARLFAFAERCPSLTHLTYVSTVYTAGLREGAIAESLDKEHGFANEYERSKWHAEQLLATKSLPWRIARVATVICDDESGRVTQQNAVHNTLRLLYYGLLSLVPGKTDTPLYFVTGKFVADALASLVQKSEERGVYHLVHRRDESLALGELVDLAFAAFNEDAAFRARRILPPLWVDAESFEVLASSIDSFGGEVTRQALGSVAPFARQLFSPKNFANDRLAAALPRYHAPEPRELARRVCSELVRTRWGRGS